jgi:hypothetical protein
MAELHYPDRVMQQFNYRQHILIDFNMSYTLHAINYRGKNSDYDWLSHLGAYVS